jgi:hypothetical protein
LEQVVTDVWRLLDGIDPFRKSPGANAVTVRALLESHAFLVEKISHWQGLDAPGYLQMLMDESACPEYRLPYDLARLRLGDGAAYAYFSLIVCLSLCDEDPPRAFDVLIDEMATWTLSQRPETIDSDFASRVAALLPASIGSAAEVADRARLAHPFYEAGLLAINESCSRGFHVLKFFTDPAKEMGIIVDDVLRRMVFRANSKEQFCINVPPRFDRNMTDVSLIYSVFSSRVLGTASASILARPATRPAMNGWLTSRPNSSKLRSNPIVSSVATSVTSRHFLFAVPRTTISSSRCWEDA